MSILLSMFIAAFWVGVYELWQTRFGKDRNVRNDNYGKMKQRLLELLRKDGFKSEMDEGVILVNYHQERFRIHFSDSAFGNAYARITVVDDYAMEGMEEVHPFVMDNLMGRASNGNPRIGNISFEDHCTCFFGTDVHKIKDFYRGLHFVLDALAENERVIRQEFPKYLSEFGMKRDAAEKSHIGFKTSSEEKVENEHRVAAETNVKTELL